jgi:hypothetical protein
MKRRIQSPNPQKNPAVELENRLGDHGGSGGGLRGEERNLGFIPAGREP